MKPFTSFKLLYRAQKTRSTTGPYRPLALATQRQCSSSCRPVGEGSDIAKNPTGPKARRPIAASRIWVNRCDFEGGGKTRLPRKRPSPPRPARPSGQLIPRGTVRVDQIPRADRPQRRTDQQAVG